MRHNEVRDTTATFSPDDCKDVEVKPSLTKLSGYEQQLSTTAKTQDDGRLYMGKRILGQVIKIIFWCQGMNENEKNNYNQQIMEVDQKSFTPLVSTVSLVSTRYFTQN